MRGSDPGDARLMRFVLELRQLGVTDSRVLGAMERTGRAAFAPDPMQGMALEDIPLPLPCGQTMSRPSLVGRMLSALTLNGGERVLEVGTGSGYQTAVLALIASKVVSVERHARLVSDARAALGRLRLDAAQVFFGDGREGWPALGPYERVVINASVTGAPPPALIGQLAPGGAIVGGLKTDDGARLMHWNVRADGGLEAIALGPIELGPLAEAPANPQYDCSAP